MGLFFFFGFFARLFRLAGKACRNGDRRGHCRMARIMAVLCCLMGIYNASMRTEAAYMAYFILALPFQRRET